MGIRRAAHVVGHTATHGNPVWNLHRNRFALLAVGVLALTI